ARLSEIRIIKQDRPRQQTHQLLDRSARLRLLLEQSTRWVFRPLPVQPVGPPSCRLTRAQPLLIRDSLGPPVSTRCRLSPVTQSLWTSIMITALALLARLGTPMMDTSHSPSSTPTLNR